MKFVIKCSCGDEFETDRNGLQYWAENVGKLRHYFAESEITFTVTLKMEESDFLAEKVL